MKKGLEFEKLAAEIFTQLSKDNIYESVEHNVQLIGQDGPRQIDILLRGKVGPFKVKTIIECKDHKSKITIATIDGLHSKMLDVNAQKSVLVARTGFTKGAIRKARRLGISLCTAHSAASEKWKFALLLPLLVVEHACDLFKLSFMFKAISSHFDAKDCLSVNDIFLNKIVANYWNNNEIECNDGLNNHMFKPNLHEPNWIKIHDGRRMEIQNLQILLRIKKSYYFGYINDLESAKYLEFYEQKQRHVIFNPNDLSNYRETMEKYYRFDQIPDISGKLILNIKLLHNPEAKFQIN